MFMCCKNESSVINLIYSGQQLLSYTMQTSTKRVADGSTCLGQNLAVLLLAIKL